MARVEQAGGHVISERRDTFRVAIELFVVLFVRHHFIASR
jgi:hypothetical protein